MTWKNVYMTISCHFYQTTTEFVNSLFTCSTITYMDPDSQYPFIHLLAPARQMHMNCFTPTISVALLEVQCVTYGKIRDVQKYKKQAGTVKKEAHITISMTQFDLAELNQFEFVKHVSFKFLPVPQNLWVFVTFDKALPCSSNSPTRQSIADLFLED